MLWEAGEGGLAVLFLFFPFPKMREYGILYPNCHESSIQCRLIRGPARGKVWNSYEENNAEAFRRGTCRGEEDRC